MSGYRPPYRSSMLVSLAVFALYAITLAPTTSWWDASEYIATGYGLGIPHPPGNPLFVTLARVWILLLTPLGLSVAVSVNLFAAFTSSVATGFFFLISHRILSRFSDKHWLASMGAVSGAIMGATAYTVWNQSNVNEKVYTVSVAVIAAVSWLALRWYDNRDSIVGQRSLLAAGYLMVLGSTNHLMSVLPVPALAVFVLAVSPAVLINRRFLVRAVLLVLVGLSFNAFLPIRASQNPAINEGDPICESISGATVAIYTNGKAGCPALAQTLSRAQYGKPAVSERQAPISHQLFNYFQYFDWQWARGADLSEQPGGGRLLFTFLFLILGLVGFSVLWKTDRAIFYYLTVLAGTLTVGLVLYLNFKYGFSLASDIAQRSAHEVRERDYFFLAGFMLWGNLAGLGLSGICSGLMKNRNSGNWKLKALPIFMIALIPLASNWKWADRSDDYAARDWAYDLLMSVEPYGVIFTNGDNDTFPLWYIQEVEGVRKDVTVIVVQYLYTDWYPKQIRDKTEPEVQFSFDPKFSTDYYKVSPVPSNPISSATDEMMDAVGSGSIQQDLGILIDGVQVVYPSGSFLARGPRFALSFIRDAIQERPIYFASSAGLLREIGLEKWGVRHGLATKLVMRDLEEETSDDGLVRASERMGAEWFDLERNLSLVRETYSYRGIRDREIWQDRSTLNIPMQYQYLFTQLADVGLTSGLPDAEVADLATEAEAFGITAIGGSRYLRLN
ncbi:MAG: DUF2723 domain-containing protein [Longimicrobiales bacterium]|nr:DUF2723 domain-containing protein [Longimicrobiales bacterium]